MDAASVLGGYPARIRTLNERIKISCVTITPRGRRCAEVDIRASFSLRKGGFRLNFVLERWFEAYPKL